MLTDKAKRDFEEWLSKESEKYHQHEWLDNDMYLDEIWLPPPIENSLIVEFFDSVGIYVDAQPWADFEDFDTYQKTVFITNVSYLEYDEMKIYDDGSDEETNVFQSRNQATEYGIKIANLIYNEK